MVLKKECRYCIIIMVPEMVTMIMIMSTEQCTTRENSCVISSTW